MLRGLAAKPGTQLARCECLGPLVAALLQTKRRGLHNEAALLNAVADDSQPHKTLSNFLDVV